MPEVNMVRPFARHVAATLRVVVFIDDERHNELTPPDAFAAFDSSQPLPIEELLVKLVGASRNQGEEILAGADPSKNAVLKILPWFDSCPVEPDFVLCNLLLLQPC